MKLAFGSSKLIDIALDVATKAHEGQTRWDKSPYINHPISVAEIVSEKYRQVTYTLPFNQDHYDSLIVSSLNHDVIEDCVGWINGEIELIDHIEKLYGQPLKTKREIVSALFNLNKHRHDGYLQFILSVNNNEIARIIKIADLTHNLSDLKKGSMRDKYELALHILEN